MTGALIGDLAGSSFSSVNVPGLRKDFGELFGTNRVEVVGLDAKDNRRNVSRIREFETRFTEQLPLSAAVMRWLLDTSFNPSLRENPLHFADSMKAFMEEYGVELSSDPRLIPSAVMPVAYAAGTVADAQRLAGVVVSWFFSQDDPRYGDYVQFAEGCAGSLKMVLDGRPLREVDEYLSERGYVSNFTDEVIRRTANEKGIVVEGVNVENETKISEIQPDRDVFRSFIAGFKAAIEAESFEDALRTAISFGGDSAVVTAVAGAFAEQLYPHESFSAVEGLALPFESRRYRCVETFERKFQGMKRIATVDVAEGIGGALGDAIRDLNAADREYVAERRSSAIEQDAEFLSFNLESGARNPKLFKEIPFPKVFVLKTGPLDTDRKYISSDDAVVEKLIKRFGEGRVLKMTEKEAFDNYSELYRSWDRPGETFLSYNRPELLTRYFVEGLPLRLRDERNELIERKVDSVVPIWKLQDAVLRTKDYDRDVWKAKKDYGSLRGALDVLEKVRSGASTKASLFDIQHSILVLKHSRDEGGWGGYVKSCLAEMKDSMTAYKKARDCWKTVVEPHKPVHDKVKAVEDALERLDGLRKELLEDKTMINTLAPVVKEFLDGCDFDQNVYSLVDFPGAEKAFAQDGIEPGWMDRLYAFGEGVVDVNTAIEAATSVGINIEDSDFFGYNQLFGDIKNTGGEENKVAERSVIIACAYDFLMNYDSTVNELAPQLETLDAKYQEAVGKYRDLRDACDVLSYEEQFYRGAYRRAEEAHEVFKGLVDGIRKECETFESTLVAKGRGEDVLMVHFSSVEDPNTKKLISPYSLEVGTDYLNVRWGDTVVGSLAIDPVQGCLQYNSNVAEGTIHNEGKISAIPMLKDYARGYLAQYNDEENQGFRRVFAESKESKVDWLLGQVKYLVFDDMSVSELQRMHVEIEDSKSSAYEHDAKNNLGDLNRTLSLSRDSSLDILEVPTDKARQSVAVKPAEQQANFGFNHKKP